VDSSAGLHLAPRKFKLRFSLVKPHSLFFYLPFLCRFFAMITVVVSFSHATREKMQYEDQKSKDSRFFNFLSRVILAPDDLLVFSNRIRRDLASRANHALGELHVVHDG